jgi:hypothetical protein
MGSASGTWTPDRHEVSLFADRALAKSGTRPHHSGGRGADQLQHLLGFHAHLFLWGVPSTPVYVAVPPLFTGVRGRKILGTSPLSASAKFVCCAFSESRPKSGHLADVLRLNQADSLTLGYSAMCRARNGAVC